MNRGRTLVGLLAILAAGCDSQQRSGTGGSAHGNGFIRPPVFIPHPNPGIHHETPHSAPPRTAPRTAPRITPVRPPTFRPSFRGGGS